MANPCDYHKTVSAKGVRRYGWFKGLTLTLLITLQVTLMLNPDLTTIISTIAGGGGGAFRGVISGLEGVDERISELYFLGGSGSSIFPSIDVCGTACEGAGSGIVKWSIITFEEIVTVISERFGGDGGSSDSIAADTSMTEVVATAESVAGSGGGGGDGSSGDVNLGGSCGVVPTSAAGVTIRFVNNTDSAQYVYRGDGSDSELEEVVALEPGEHHDEPAAEGELFEVYSEQGAWMSDDPFQYYTASYTAVDAQSQCVTLEADGGVEVAATSTTTSSSNATSEERGSVDDSQYYRLQSMYVEDENKCLEGNYLENGTILNGAAFMDDCQDVAGQLWKIVAVEDGYYFLQTLFLEDEGKCLVGNRLAQDSVLGGAAFMADCEETPDQLWQFIEAEAGYYYMQTLLSEEEGSCFESNRLADGAFLEGAAYMDACQNVTGQLWKLMPVP